MDPSQFNFTVNNNVSYTRTQYNINFSREGASSQSHQAAFASSSYRRVDAEDLLAKKRDQEAYEAKEKALKQVTLTFDAQFAKQIQCTNAYNKLKEAEKLLTTAKNEHRQAEASCYNSLDANSDTQEQKIEEQKMKNKTLLEAQKKLAKQEKLCFEAQENDKLAKKEYDKCSAEYNEAYKVYEALNPKKPLKVFEISAADDHASEAQIVDFITASEPLGASQPTFE